MTNPWLEIPLDDYEGHMALPEVGQAQLLTSLLAEALAAFAPSSILVIGCSGGNGFDRIPESCRVVGIDINPAYLERARTRFADRFAALELHAGDILSTHFSFVPVDLAFAGLVFEYVDPAAALARIRRMLTPGGVLATVIQLPDEARAPVTPTSFASLRALAPVMRLVTPDEVGAFAVAAGFAQLSSRRVRSAGGKHFQAQVFRAVPG